MAPERDEPALHLRFAQRRLVESHVLLEQGRVDPSVLEDMEYHARAALRGLQHLPPEVAQPLLEELQALTLEQQRTLAEHIDWVPLDQRVYVEAAIEAGSTRTSLIREMTDTFGLPWDPGESEPTETRESTEPLEPAETPEPTETPEPVESPEPSETPEPTETPKPTKTPKTPKPPKDKG